MRKAFFPISLQPNSNWQSLAVATIQSLDPMMNERPQERRALFLSFSADAAFGAKAAKILFSSSSLSLMSDPRRRRNKKNEAALCFQLSPLLSLSALSLASREEGILSLPLSRRQGSCVVASLPDSNLPVYGSVTGNGGKFRILWESRHS